MAKTVPLSLETKFAGLNFRSPVGVGAVGRPLGGNLTAESHAEVLLKHAEAGVGYIYMPICSYVTEEIRRKVKERAKPEKVHAEFPHGARFLRADTGRATDGVEGMYTIITHPCSMTIDQDSQDIQHGLDVIGILKRKKPDDVRLIANTTGYSDLTESYVEAAKFWAEQGADMIEINLSCPAQPAMAGAIEDYYEESFSTRWPGAIIGQIPEKVEDITREVVKAVNVPVGVKLPAEIGFPPLVGFARRIRDAGAKFISVINCAITIAPPDIYNRGRSPYPFVNGNAFCGATGSWLRFISYKDVAAIARFVPGIDITASGGMVTPQHCVEMMMLGAGLVQITTGIMEQGRSLLTRCNQFIDKFIAEQGYRSTGEIIGLGQQHIKYLEELDMAADKVKAVTDEKKCNNCGICADAICTVRNMENGKLKVNEENCIGCGACLLACRMDAIRLEKVA